MTETESILIIYLITTFATIFKRLHLRSFAELCRDKKNTPLNWSSLIKYLQVPFMIINYLSRLQISQNLKFIVLTQTQVIRMEIVLGALHYESQRYKTICVISNNRTYDVIQVLKTFHAQNELHTEYMRQQPALALKLSPKNVCQFLKVVGRRYRIRVRVQTI